MPYYGKLTGKTYDSLEAMLHYEKEEAMRRDVPTPEELALYEIPEENLRALADRASRTNAERSLAAQTWLNVQTWFELHPEIIQCPENRGEILFHFGQRGNDNPTMQELEDFYDLAIPYGRLKLNQAAIQKRQKEKVQQRARDIEAKGGIRALDSISEEDAYNMPMDELRRKATLDHVARGGELPHRGPVRTSTTVGR